MQLYPILMLLAALLTLSSCTRVGSLAGKVNPSTVPKQVVAPPTPAPDLGQTAPTPTVGATPADSQTPVDVVTPVNPAQAPIPTAAPTTQPTATPAQTATPTPAPLATPNPAPTAAPTATPTPSATPVPTATPLAPAATPQTSDGAATTTPAATPAPLPVTTANIGDFNCPSDHAVSGIDDKGHPICTYAGVDGFYPIWDGVWSGNRFYCPRGFTLKQFSNSEEEAKGSTWMACMHDDVARAEPSHMVPSYGFTCPLGTVLRGFDKDGQFICRSTSQIIPQGFGRAPEWGSHGKKESFFCPYGTKLRRHNFECTSKRCDEEDSEIFICERTGKADRNVSKIKHKPVTNDSRLLKQECSELEVVTGFSRNGQIICAKATSSGVPSGYGLIPAKERDKDERESDKKEKKKDKLSSFSCPVGRQLKLLHFEREKGMSSSWYGCY